MKRKTKQQKVSPDGGLDYESKEFGMLIVAPWPLLFSSRSVCFTEFDPEAVGGAKRRRRKRRKKRRTPQEEVPPLWKPKGNTSLDFRAFGKELV